MTKPQMEYFVLAIIILLAVAGIIITDYLGNYPLTSPASIILSVFIMWVSIIIYRLLQYNYFKTVVLAKSYNWLSLFVMILIPILQLWHGNTDLLLGFPKNIVFSVLFFLIGTIGFFKFVPKKKE